MFIKACIHYGVQILMVILIFRRRQGRCIAMWYYVPVICSFLDARRFHLQLIIISKGKTIWFLLVVSTDERNGGHPFALLIWQKLLGQIKMWVDVSFRKFHLLNLNTAAFISYIAPFFQEHGVEGLGGRGWFIVTISNILNIIRYDNSAPV